MDNQNTKKTMKKLSSKVVLILVLMDNQNTICGIAAMILLFCLNPCSNG